MNLYTRKIGCDKLKMMKSVIKKFAYSNSNDIQRVQIISWDSWDDLFFLHPDYSEQSFINLGTFYKNVFARKYANFYGKSILFRLPDSLESEIPMYDSEYGHMLDMLVAANVALRKNSRYFNGAVRITEEKARKLYGELTKKNCLQIANGNLPFVDFMPVSGSFGFLSTDHNKAPVKVNSSFFIMDRFDCSTGYDVIGNPIGLCVKNGIVENPPLFDREVLLVDEDHNVKITRITLSDLEIQIDNTLYADGENCKIYSRPDYKKTPAGGFDIVITGNNVVAYKENGNTPVPGSGFVMKLPEKTIIHRRQVIYRGLEKVRFALQVGNSVMVDGVKTERFLSRFHNFLNIGTVSYPPSMYPRNYRSDRAPRIVLGADRDNKPMLIWFEGAGKFGHVPGEESCGASLAEAVDICEKLGVYNGINLDGGGSAQILVKGVRKLKISDRDPDDYSEIERAVPIGLYVR